MSSRTLFDEPTFNERLFFPRRDARPPPEGATDVMVPVDGASLHVRAHRAGTARADLVLFHGNGEVVSDYDGYGPVFERAGARLIVAEFRGYGRSTGTPTLRAALDDVRPTLAAVDQLVGVGRPRVIMGRSLGSQCAFEAAGSPDLVAHGWIFDSAPTDLAALVRRRQLPVPESFEEPLLARFDPLRKASRIRAPALIVHGAEDALVLPREAEALARVIPNGLGELAWIRGAGHNDLHAFEPFWTAVAALIARAVAYA
jgi:pimeloyl-ACP methyl ester carboxylesterase